MKNKTTKRLLAMTMALTFALSSTIITPTTASAAASKTVTVKTQKQLEAALKDKKVTSIVIKTSKNVTLKIKDGDYGKKSLTVASPKATINNYGDFKKISVNDGKAFIDRGAGNSIVVKDTNSLKLTTGKQSSDTKITVSAKGGKISIVNNGSVNAINVKAKSTVTVSGNAKEAPTITNNAAGAKIVAAQDADVVLNKKASLTVKAGASLGSLTAKADSTITVAAGATVKDVSIAGNASKVDLTVNGTVGNVTVDAKAEVAVGGNTTATVAITNNVEGASISSEVKTDVTLNADAKVSLDKGAEGSNVVAGNADVKPDVTNNTSEKVTVTDSTGKDTTVESGKDTGNTGNTGNVSSGTDSTGGNNPGGGSIETSATKITATITVPDAGLVPGSVLTATASNSKGAEAVYTYVWMRDGKDVLLYGSDTYTITEWDSGSTISVKASAEGMTDGVATTGIVQTIGELACTEVTCNIPYGLGRDVAVEYLGDTTAFVNNNTGRFWGNVKITWSEDSSPTFSGTAPGTYTFTGTVDLPANWIWKDGATKEITGTLTVLSADALKFSYSKSASDVNTNQAKLDTVVYDGVSYDGVIGEDYDCSFKGNLLKLTQVSHGNEAAYWVCADVKLTGEGEGAKTDASKLSYRVGNTGDFTSVTESDSNAVVTKPEDATDTVTVWLKADELCENQVTINFKYDSGDTITPITFWFDQIPIKMTGYDYSKKGTTIPGGKVGNCTPIAELDLESKILFSDGANSYPLDVNWNTSDDYGTYSGKCRIDAYPKDGYAIDFPSNFEFPYVECEILKGDQEAPAVDSLENLFGSDCSSIWTGEFEEDYEFYLGTSDTLPQNLTKENWTIDPYWENLKSATAYYLFVRYAENENYNASPARGPITVYTAPASPETKSKTSTSITVVTASGLQYACSIQDAAPDKESPDWKSTESFDGTFDHLQPATTYYIFARVADVSAVSEPLCEETECIVLEEIPALADIDAGVEGNVKEVDVLGLPKVIICTGAGISCPVYVEWETPDDYSIEKAGIYEFTCQLDDKHANDHDYFEFGDQVLPYVRVIVHAAPLTQADVIVSGNTITVANLKEGYEYACSIYEDGVTGAPADHWQASSTFIDLNPKNKYKLFVRVAGMQETVSGECIVPMNNNSQEGN